MGSTHHLVVSRRRGPQRQRPTLRRVHAWQPRASREDEGWDDGSGPDSELVGTASMLDVPSRFLRPMRDPNDFMLAPMAGHVRVATIIDEDDLLLAPPAPSVLDLPLNRLTWRDPFDWLVFGWQDFTQARGIGLFHGACFVLMGWLLLACFRMAPPYTLALSAGFLLMAPFLCLGLYDASRAISRGRHPSLLSSLTAWRANRGQLAIFAGALLVLEMLWARAVLVVFAVSFDGVPDFSGPIQHLFTGEMPGFLVPCLAVGIFFAGLIYAIGVIGMPMLMDMEDADAISAGLTSMRLVLTQTGVMLLWGTIVTVLVVVAMLPGFLGLLVAGPVLGHASWHAYKAVVTPRRTGR